MPAIRDRGESSAPAPRTGARQTAAFAAQRAGERNPNIWTGDIEALRALEAARRRARLQQQALSAALAAQRAGERTWSPGNSSAGADNASGISSGSGASGEDGGYQDYRQGEYETFVADLPGFIPLRNEDAWSEWMRAEKWGTDLSTQQSISAFIGLVTASGQVEASDSAALDALSALFRENLGDTENNILYTLLGSGALTGLGVTQYTIDYLTGDFNVQLAENAQNQVLAVQGMIADEILRFIDQGLLPTDAEAFAERALLDPSNMGILMALFHEGLENLSEEEQRAYDLYGMNIDYWKDTVVPFYFRSQTEDLYAPDTTPYGDMLLFVMSFYPVLDQIAAAIDLARSLYEGDVLGTALSMSDFLPGPNLGAADNLLRAAGRNADEAGGVDNIPASQADNQLGEINDGIRATNRRQSFYVYNQHGRPLAEFDGYDIESATLIEYKNASGLEPNAMSRDGSRQLYTNERARLGEINDWVQGQIVELTEKHIRALSEGNASYTGYTTGNVPNLESIQNFRTIEIHISSTDTALMDVVNMRLNGLQSSYPDWTITVIFGSA